MKSTASLDRSQKEGHGDSSTKPTLSKGQFVGVGTYADLQHEPTSPNKKSGPSSGGEQ